MAGTAKRWWGRFRAWLGDQRGLGLVESLVAVSILGTSVVALVTALCAGSIAVREGSQAAVAQGLARAQLEYIKSCPYATGYAAMAAPEGYALAVEVGAIPGAGRDLQKITVAVSQYGEDILVVEGYKVNR